MTFPNRFLVIIPCIVIFGRCEYSIVIFWGKPTNYSSTNSLTISTSSWEDCVNYCYDSIYCVLASGNEESCVIYDFETVFEVKKLEAKDGLKVAMKINSTQQNCPDTMSTSSTTLEIKDPTYPYTIFSYTITYSNDIWNFKYNLTRLCPPEWKLYSRPTTDFCLRLYGNPKAAYTQKQATAFCESVNATLAGLESYDERYDMTSQGLSINQKDARGLAHSGFWVSGIRKSTCSTVAQVATAACNGSKAFDFTDKYITTLSGYKWGSGQPDGVSSTRAYQDCIILRTQTGGTALLGVIDDLQCTYSTGRDFDVHGFVCGKIPGI